MSETIKDIIAERELLFISDDGKKFDCRLLIGKPYKMDNDHFECQYQIAGHPQRKIFKASGTDSLGAFMTAIELANIQLAHRYEGKFYYEGTEDTYLILKDYRQS